MTCEEIRKALLAYESCVETEAGSRVVTHCLYPSFEPVCVYVERISTGFRVHDNAGALRSIWDHGREHKSIKKLATRQADKYRVMFSGNHLFVEVENLDWLPSAILAVANASAATANAALDRSVAISESQLKDKILAILEYTVPEKALAKEFEQTGKSGKIHRFDFAVSGPRDSLILIDAVAPHHVSVSAKYVAFADMTETVDGKVAKFAVHDRPLDPGDVALLQQVADIVPFKSLEPGVKKLTLQ